MAELHVIGQFESASGFSDPRLFLVWQLQHGGGWRILNGHKEGQTQTDFPSLSDNAHFCHPIDVHLSTRTIQGWPQLQLQVWQQDDYGRQALCAYGTIHVPTSPGYHKLTCHTWRVQGSFREEVLHRFVGGGVQLSSVDSVMNSPIKVSTVAMGTIHISISIITRHFDKFGIEC